MSAQTLDVIRDRIEALITDTFGFKVSASPFSLDREPNAAVDRTFRVTATFGQVVGGSAFSETRVDLVSIELARMQEFDPQTVYRTLVQDVSSLTAAVVRDGATGGGDYHVPDSGRGWQIEQRPEKPFAVLRLTLPVDYEAQL